MNEHPGEVLEHFVAKLEEVPGVSVERGSGVGYAIKRLKSLYDYERARIPVKVGDIVRVNDDTTYGTSGLDVAGREGKVVNIDWNSSWEYWSVTVELVAGYTDWRGEKKETSRAKHFSFGHSDLTVVGVVDAHLLPSSKQYEAMLGVIDAALDIAPGYDGHEGPYLQGVRADEMQALNDALERFREVAS